MSGRFCIWVLAMCGLSACRAPSAPTSASALPPRASAAAPASSATDVHGLVLGGRDGLPLAGHVVAVGDQRATSDADGRFVLRNVPPRYDLVIVNAEHSLVSVFVGVSRRDPIVVQSVEKHDPERATRHADLNVALSGSTDPASTEGLRIHFRGTFANADLFRSGQPAPAAAGSTIGPFKLAWDGPASFQGELIALKQEKTPARALCGRASVTVKDQAKASAALALKEVPVVHRAPARVDYPRTGFSKPQLYADYHFPGSQPVLNADASRVREYDIADLESCGAVLCHTAFIYNPYLHSNASTCGPVSEKPVVLTLPEAPKFKTPTFGTPARVGLPFAWSALRDAIYELKITPSDERNPTAPAIRVFTRETSVAWPDLAAFGVEFPKPLKAYGAAVQALGPYSTLDDALGPEGLSFETRTQAWSSESQPLSVPIDPPLGKEEAACQYPYGTAIVCGKPTNSVEGVPEHYMLAAINNKLRHYPDFANAVNIHCVRDCAGGRAFFAAYVAYSKSHPGFDSGEPMDPFPPPPPPPPELQRRIEEGD